MVTPFPQHQRNQFHGEKEESFTAMPISPSKGRDEFQLEGTQSMFYYYPATKYADDGGVINRGQKLDFGGNDSVSFFPADGRRDLGQTMMKTTQDGESETGTLRFFHELGVHLRDDSNSSVMKPTISGDEDTLSLFPEIKMEAEDVKASSTTLKIEDYNEVFHSGRDILKESQKVPEQSHESRDWSSHFSGQLLLYENNVPTAQSNTLFQERGMMVRDDMHRRGEEAFSIQLHNQICSSQRTQSDSEGGRGGSVPVMSVSTSTAEGLGQSALSPLSSSLSLHPKQNKMPFLPSSFINSGEFCVSPNPARKLETVGGKKVFSSQYQNLSRSGNGLTDTNLNSGFDEYKITNPGNPSAQYVAHELRRLSSTTTPGNFREPHDLMSSSSLLGQKSLITPNLRDEYSKDQSFSPAFTPSVYPKCVQTMKTMTRSISNGSKADDSENLQGSHGYTVNHLQTQSKLSYSGSMAVDNSHGLIDSVLYAVPGSSGVLRNQPISDGRTSYSTGAGQGDVLKGYRDELLASYANSKNSHPPIQFEDHSVLRSISFEVLGIDRVESSDYAVPGSSGVIRNQPISVERTSYSTEDGQGNVFKGYGDEMLDSYATTTNSHSPIHFEDNSVRQSRLFQVLGKNQVESAGVGNPVNFTARRSSLSIDSVEPECTISQDSCMLTNFRKDKRWIYKQARLKKRPIPSVDSKSLTRRGRRRRSSGALGHESRVRNISSSCATNIRTEQQGRHEGLQFPSSSGGDILPVYACADIMVEEGNSLALSTSDYLDN